MRAARSPSRSGRAPTRPSRAGARRRWPRRTRGTPAPRRRRASSSPPRGGAPEPSGSGCQRPWSVWRQPGAPRLTPPGRPQPQRGDDGGEAVGRLLGRDRVVRGDVALQHAQERGASPPRGRPRRASTVAAHERQPVAELDPLGLHPGAAQRRDHAGAHGVAVEGHLDLAVHAVEALLGEAEAGGVLVQPLEHRLKRRLGLLAAQAVHAQPGGRAGSELVAGLRAGGQLAQPRPALREERAGARLVAVEGRPAAGALVDDVELDLGAGLQVVGEQRRGLQREVPQRVVESTVTHGSRIRAGRGDPAQWWRQSSGLAG